MVIALHTRGVVQQFARTAPARVLVGRGRDVDIRIAAPVIARHHCAIEVTEHGVFVTDLKSTGGIWLGACGPRLAARTRITPGDHVHLLPDAWFEILEGDG